MNIFDITSKDINPKRWIQHIPISNLKDEGYLLYYRDNRIEILMSKTEKELKDILTLREVKPIQIFIISKTIKLQKIRL